MSETILSILQSSDTPDEPETDTILSTLEGAKEKSENLKKIFQEVNTMIKNLKTNLVIPKSENKLTSSITEEQKKRLSTIFSDTSSSETSTLDTIVSNINTVKDKAIFGLIVDMIYETIQNSS
jgi:hypothetical protein